MNIETLPEQPAADAPGSALQQRFDRLRKNLAREEKKQQKFIRELDELGHLYAKQIMPRLKNNHRLLKTLLQRLIDFSAHKNLRQWHREKLEAWLYQLLEQVSMYDRNEAAAIARQYMKIQLETFGKSTQIPDPYAADAGTEQTDAAEPEPVAADSTAPEGDTPDNIESDPQRAFVHYHLYASTRKKQQQNLDRLLERIRLMRLQLPGVLDELRSLKDLKRELQYRQQDRY